MDQFLYQSIGHALTFFAILALAGVSARTRSRVDLSTGAHVMQYPALFKAIGWLLSAGFGVLVVVVFRAERVPNSLPSWSVPALLVALAASLTATLDFMKTSVGWTDHELVQTSPWTGEKRMPWADVTSVTYSTINQWFVFESRTGVKIRVHYWLSGIRELLTEVRQRLDYATCEGALEGFDNHA